MKKHELIKHAYDKYQKGTICTWYNNRKDFHYTEFQSSGEFEFDDEGDIFINYPDDQIVEYIYCDGKWAKIVAQYPPKKEFVMVSEDGVELNQNDLYFKVYKNPDAWVFDYDKPVKILSKSDAVLIPQLYKAFSTKEAAEKFCEEQNKPRNITLFKDSEYPTIICRDYFRVMFATTKNNICGIHFTKEEFEQISEAFNKLKS